MPAASGAQDRLGQTRSSQRQFVMIGLDHTTAGIELRERVAFAPAEIPAALTQLTVPTGPLLDQATILSTCNRVELYGVGRSARPTEELVAFLARYHGLESRELSQLVSVRRGDEVAHHLAATAAGINSPVIGEAQILGQVRAALEQALRAGTAGPELRRLFEAAIAAGRRVRSRTAIGRGAASVPQASVDFAHRRLGTLRQSSGLLIGAGRTAELAAKQLVKRGVGQLLIAGGDQVRAERLAERYAGRALTAAGISEACARSDLVITSTGTVNPILSREQIEHALAHRGRAGSRPLLLIDLSVPRDVDPSVAGLAGVEVHTIDDLMRVTEHALAHRRAELPAAHALLWVEVARFSRWLRRREAAADQVSATSVSTACAAPWPRLCRESTVHTERAMPAHPPE